MKYGTSNKLTLNVVISQLNYVEIEKFIILANKYKLFYLRLANDGEFYLPNSEKYFVGAREILDINPIIDKLYENEEHIIDVAAQNNVMLIYDLPRRIKNKTEHVNISDKNIKSECNKKKCRVPWISLYLDSDGSIKGHCCCNNKLDHTYSSLLKFWNGNIMQQYRKEMKNGSFSHYCGSQYGFFDTYL